MAKGEPEPIMAPAQLKPLLLKSKREPVNCAVGMSKDKQGHVMLDRMAKPRKVVALMKKKAAGSKIDLDATTIRFGRAHVDTDVDSSLVTFTVNKEAAATLRPKLLEMLKKCGFTRCEIIVDAAIEDEPEEDEAGGTVAAPAPAAAAAAPAGGTSMGSPVFDEARSSWVTTRKTIESELDKLHVQIKAVYAGHGAAAELDKAFRGKIEPMMEKLDESLSKKLSEVVGNTDPATHGKLVGEARQIITNYERYLSSEPLIARLDANPFVPLAIQKTLTATLEKLSKSVV